MHEVDKNPISEAPATIKQPVVVIVDAMSTARHYADGLAKVGLHCVHVQSSDSMHPRFHREFIAGKYLENILAHDHRRIDALRDRYDVLCVLPGQDPVAPLADALASRLAARFANAPETSALRVDKYEMIAGIAHQGLRAPSCDKLHTREELESFLSGNPTYPIVVKPPRSAGVDLVEICPDGASVVNAVEAIFQTRNVYGAANEYAVVQSFIEGQEYMVDTVSADGRAHLIAVWKMTRAGSGMLYPLHAVTLDPRSDEAQIAFSYVSKVLAALRHDFGPAHCEIKIDGRGPTLIEINPRLHGSLDVTAIEAATGESQISYLGKWLTARTPSASVDAPARVLKAYLISPIEGTLSRDLDLSCFRRLPSFYSLDAHLDAGRQLQKTKTLTTAAGYIYLSSSSEDELRDDYSAFRAMEARMWAEAQVDSRDEGST